jgi:hypothetical protein
VNLIPFATKNCSDSAPFRTNASADTRRQFVKLRQMMIASAGEEATLPSRQLQPCWIGRNDDIVPVHHGGSVHLRIEQKTCLSDKSCCRWIVVALHCFDTFPSVSDAARSPGNSSTQQDFTAAVSQRCGSAGRSSRSAYRPRS